MRHRAAPSVRRVPREGLNASIPGVDVQLIGAAETAPVRQVVLRPGRPPETCLFDGDEGPCAFHLGAFEDGTIVGVATFLPGVNELFTESEQFKLRGMAVLPEHRGRGLGSALILAALPMLQDAGCSVLWCSARVTAVPFYERHGFATIGEVYVVPITGPHIVMYRRLP